MGFDVCAASVVGVVGWAVRVAETACATVVCWALAVAVCCGVDVGEAVTGGDSVLVAVAVAVDVAGWAVRVAATAWATVVCWARAVAVCCGVAVAVGAVVGVATMTIGAGVAIGVRS